MLTGEILFVSDGLASKIRKKYDGNIVFAVGTSDYTGTDYFVVYCGDGEGSSPSTWMYIAGDHTPYDWTERKCSKLTSEQLLDFLENNSEIAKSWMDFRDDKTGNMKHTGPSYMGLIGQFKYDLGMEE